MSRFAERIQGSIVRRFMLNAYGDLSGDPSVGGGCEIDATALLRFLERVNADAPVRITVTHVMVKAIADSLRKYPELNVKVIGRRIYQLKHVDVRVAVNLFPSGEDSPEVFMIMLEDADQKTLTEIARQCSSAADRSREVATWKTLAGRLLRLTQYVPDSIFDMAMQLVLRVTTSGRLAQLGLMRDPMGSIALTNVGPFGLPQGVGNIYASGLLPRFGYASLVVVLPLQDKAVVVDGEVQVRPMLPFGVGIDHRAIDGWKIFRYMRCWSDALQDPDAYFADRL